MDYLFGTPAGQGSSSTLTHSTGSAGERLLSADEIDETHGTHSNNPSSVVVPSSSSSWWFSSWFMWDDPERDSLSSLRRRSMTADSQCSTLSTHSSRINCTADVSHRSRTMTVVSATPAPSIIETHSNEAGMPVTGNSSNNGIKKRRRSKRRQKSSINSHCELLELDDDHNEDDSQSQSVEISCSDGSILTQIETEEEEEDPSDEASNHPSLPSEFSPHSVAGLKDATVSSATGSRPSRAQSKNNESKGLFNGQSSSSLNYSFGWLIRRGGWKRRKTQSISLHSGVDDYYYSPNKRKKTMMIRKNKKCNSNSCCCGIMTRPCCLNIIRRIQSKLGFLVMALNLLCTNIWLCFASLFRHLFVHFSMMDVSGYFLFVIGSSCLGFTLAWIIFKLTHWILNYLDCWSLRYRYMKDTTNKHRFNGMCRVSFYLAIQIVLLICQNLIFTLVFKESHFFVLRMTSNDGGKIAILNNDEMRFLRKLSDCLGWMSLVRRMDDTSRMWLLITVRAIMDCINHLMLCDLFFYQCNHQYLNNNNNNNDDDNSGLDCDDHGHSLGVSVVPSSSFRNLMNQMFVPSKVFILRWSENNNDDDGDSDDHDPSNNSHIFSPLQRRWFALRCIVVSAMMLVPFGVYLRLFGFDGWNESNDSHSEIRRFAMIWYGLSFISLTMIVVNFLLSVIILFLKCLDYYCCFIHSTNNGFSFNLTRKPHPIVGSDIDGGGGSTVLCKTTTMTATTTIEETVNDDDNTHDVICAQSSTVKGVSVVTSLLHSSPELSYQSASQSVDLRSQMSPTDTSSAMKPSSRMENAMPAAVSAKQLSDPSIVDGRRLPLKSRVSIKSLRNRNRSMNDSLSKDDSLNHSEMVTRVFPCFFSVTGVSYSSLTYSFWVYLLWYFLGLFITLVGFPEYFLQ